MKFPVFNIGIMSFLFYFSNGVLFFKLIGMKLLRSLNSTSIVRLKNIHQIAYPYNENLLLTCRFLRIPTVYYIYLGFAVGILKTLFVTAAKTEPTVGFEQC